MTKPNQTIWPALHPDNVELVPTPFRTESWAVTVRATLSAAHEAVRRFHVALGALEADGSLTVDGRRVLAATAADRILQPRMKDLDNAFATVRLERATANTSIEHSLRAPSGVDPAEVRSALASLTPAERRAVLEDAVGAGDRAVVGPVLGATPSWVAGVSKAEADNLRARWAERHAPEAAARLAALDVAAGVIERAGAALLGVYAAATAAAKDATERVSARKKALEAT